MVDFIFVCLTVVLVLALTLLIETLQQSVLLNRLNKYCAEVNRSNWPRVLSSEFESWRFRSVLGILKYEGEINWTIPQQLIEQAGNAQENQKTLRTILESFPKSVPGNHSVLILCVLEITASIDAVHKNRQLLFDLAAEPRLSLHDYSDLDELERERVKSVANVIVSMHSWYCKGTTKLYR